jgi:hypothetical protein
MVHVLFLAVHLHEHAVGGARDAVARGLDDRPVALGVGALVRQPSNGTNASATRASVIGKNTWMFAPSSDFSWTRMSIIPSW